MRMSASISLDDVLNVSDKYTWTKTSELPLEDFLNKYRPSMVQNDGTKPWIWVEGSDAPEKDTNVDEACEEAQALLKEVTERVQAIQNDPSIPTRSNKKTGAKSKKELREQIQSEATAKLEEISLRHGYVSGKWLIFAPPDRVDLIWHNIATSLVTGPLSSTVAYLTKVATSPEHETPHYQHIICVYVPDVYNKEAVTEVMRVLLKHHGATLSGVKSNLYTSIGLDSKHPSGIPSTVWKNTALLKESEIKELKNEFFASLSTKKTGSDQNQVVNKEPADGGTKPADSVTKAKEKLKLKKKKANNDPFMSDDEVEVVDRLNEPKAGAISKRPKTDEEEENEEKKPKPKRARTAEKLEIKHLGKM